ncbi:MAG: DipZ protein, partial [Micavibrio sp.]|nr:DipZ protein [Micavibrio sp.]
MSSIAFQTGQAFFEGLGLAFSPCILPILPLILAGGATGSRRKPFGTILGFIVFFTVFALVSRQILSVFGIAQDTLQTISFALLMLFGLVMLVPFLETRFSRLTQGIANRAQSLGNTGPAAGDGFKGGVFLGGLIGLVWTPCAGPIMAAALLQVIQSKTNLDAVAVIAAFSLGAAVPMLVIALASKTLIARVRGLNHHTALIRRVIGILLIVFAGLGFMGFNLGVAAVGSGTSQDLATSARPDSAALIDGVPQTYRAPELAGIVQWMNTEPLMLAQLKGKVVLIDFWTYSCINCIRTLPYLKDWYAKYKDQGLVIIGVHTPEFAFEGKPDNVAAALKKFGILYPVAMDNNFATWNAYTNKYWPAHYLIDKDGRINYVHFGEGRYDVTEHNIRTLLGISGAVEKKAEMKVVSQGQTQETYLGKARAMNEFNGDVTALPLHHWQ